MIPEHRIRNYTVTRMWQIRAERRLAFCGALDHAARRPELDQRRPGGGSASGERCQALAAEAVEP
jgi:hypothetical protein